MSVFFCNDLVLAVKSSKECNLNHFWKVFNFVYSVYYRENFYFYWLTLHFEMTYTNCAYSDGVTKSFEIKPLIQNNFALAAKGSKECTLTHFWQVFSSFYSVYYRPNLYFYWLTLLSEATQMNCASVAIVNESFEINVIFCNNLKWLQKLAKRAPRTIFGKFSVLLTQFTIGKTFTSTGIPFVLNWLIRTAPPRKGWLSPYR